MEEKYIIDKVYTFKANDGGSLTDVDIHLRLNHDDVMYFGEFFAHNDLENDEVDDGNIKDKLDEASAKSIAQSMYEEYVPEEDDDQDKSIEDFYDSAYDYIGNNYLYYLWSQEFKQDCITHFKINQS